MSKKAVAICVPQIPFFPTGVTLFAKRLKTEVEKRGCDGDLIVYPMRWEPEKDIATHSIAWRILELQEANGRPINKLVCLSYPSFLAKHKDKTAWLLEPPEWPFMMKSENATHATKESFNSMVTNGLNECRKKFSSFDGNHLGLETLCVPSRLDFDSKSEKTENFILCASSHRLPNNIHDLVNAFSKANDGVKLIISGKGPETENLKKSVTENNLSDKVEFPGFLTDDELIKLYKKCLAVYCGNDHTLANSEAAACDKPIIKHSNNIADDINKALSGELKSSPTPRPTWDEVFKKII